MQWYLIQRFIYMCTEIKIRTYLFMFYLICDKSFWHDLGIVHWIMFCIYTRQTDGWKYVTTHEARNEETHVKPCPTMKEIGKVLQYYKWGPWEYSWCTSLISYSQIYCLQHFFFSDCLGFICFGNTVLSYPKSHVLILQATSQIWVTAGK